MGVCQKACLRKAIGIGKILRKAARSVNRHIDRGDCTPNKEKLRRASNDLICELKSIVTHFENENKPKASEFAKHLVERARELREMRFSDKVTTRANRVKRFETAVAFAE